MPVMVLDGTSMGACLALATLSAFSFGCASLSACDTSDDGNPPDPYFDGITENGHYMSADWTGPLLPFTAGKRYKFHHGLGCTPHELSCWVSFNAEGIHNGSIAPPAGNMCVVQEINDQFILIKNDTCSDMYVMVTASSDGCVDAGTSDVATEVGE